MSGAAGAPAESREQAAAAWVEACQAACANGSFRLNCVTFEHDVLILTSRGMAVGNLGSSALTVKQLQLCRIGIGCAAWKELGGLASNLEAME